MGQNAQRFRAQDEVDDVPAFLRTIEDDASKRRLSFQPEVTFDDGVLERKFAHLHRPMTTRTRFKTAQHAVLGRPGAESPEPVLGQIGREGFFEQRLGFGALDVSTKDAKQNQEDTDESHGFVSPLILRLRTLTDFPAASQL